MHCSDAPCDDARNDAARPEMIAEISLLELEERLELSSILPDLPKCLVRDWAGSN